MPRAGGTAQPAGEVVPEAAALGSISTFAGNGYEGEGFGGYSGDNGPATEAELGLPQGIAFDAEGNLYIADEWNNRIRRVDHATGIITTFAGGNALTEACEINFSCGDGGQATSAIVYLPDGVAFDKSGNLYIADYGLNAVRKVDTKGIITTVAGLGLLKAGASGDNGPAIDAELSGPYGVGVDATGNVYIADTGSNRIRKVTVATGVIKTVAGGGSGCGNSSSIGDGCPATDASLTEPVGVAFDAKGNLYIADSGDEVIRVVNETSQVISTFAGGGGLALCPKATDSFGDGCPATQASLDRPAAISFYAGGNLYISDFGESLVRKVNTSGIIEAAAGNGTPGFDGTGGPATSAEIDGPVGIAFDAAGNLYFADSENQVVRTVTYASSVPTATPTFSPKAGTYTSTQTVTIADATKGAVIYYTTNGETPSKTSATYSEPLSVSETTTIEAIAIASGDMQSAVAPATYTINEPQAATPVITPASNAYVEAQLVAISDATKGAAIYYTTNGEAPTASSAKYTAPFLVSTAEEVRAIAIAPNFADSAVATASYTVTGSPSALAAPATGVSASAATIHAIVSTLGLSGTCVFHYGTSATALTHSTSQTALSASGATVNASAPLAGLAAKTTYFYQATVTTAGGTASSAVASFSTN